MKKNKKNKAGKNSLLRGAAKSLRKMGKGRLSTTQKVVAGTTLVALGLSYLAKRRSSPAAATDAAATEENMASMEEAGSI